MYLDYFLKNILAVLIKYYGYHHYKTNKKRKMKKNHYIERLWIYFPKNQ